MSDSGRHTFSSAIATPGTGGQSPRPKCLFVRPGLVLPITWGVPPTTPAAPLLVDLLYQGQSIVPERQRPLSCQRGVFFWSVPATLTPGVLEIRILTLTGQLVAQQTRLVILQPQHRPVPGRIPVRPWERPLAWRLRRWGVRRWRWARAHHIRWRTSWDAGSTARSHLTRWSVQALAQVMMLAGVGVLLYPALLALSAAQAQAKLHAAYLAPLSHSSMATAVSNPAEWPTPTAHWAMYWASPSFAAPPALPPATAPVTAAATPASTRPRACWPARLRVPGVGLDLMVQDGVDPQTLAQGPGHDPQTAVPGTGSNCVLAAHRNLTGPSFRPLIYCHKGDLVTLETRQSHWRYRVASIRTVHEQDRSILCPSPNERLTLFTCTGARSQHRLVVVATAVPMTTLARAGAKGD